MRALVVLLVLAGCGGSDDGDVTPFIGVYSVTSHTQAQAAGTKLTCAAAAPAVMNGMAYFKLAVDDFFMDDSLLRLSECTDADGATCTDTLVSMHADGAGLASESANTQTGGGTMCQLYFERQQATLTGSSVRVEAFEKFDAPAIASSACTLDKAEALASSPDCRTVERWEGARF